MMLTYNKLNEILLYQILVNGTWHCQIHDPVTICHFQNI